jgi:hypothetical protein
MLISGEWGHRKVDHLVCHIEWLEVYPDTNVGKAGPSTVIYILSRLLSKQKCYVLLCKGSNGALSTHLLAGEWNHNFCKLLTKSSALFYIYAFLIVTYAVYIL